MHSTTLSFTTLQKHGDLFANFFRARQQNFGIQRNWDLPDVQGMEFDQYDTPQSRWVAVHQDGKVLGGMRLTPTTARCGIYSYMIRDAQRGILGRSIPSDLLYEEAPVDERTWECTRLFVDRATPDALRRTVQRALVDSMVGCAREVGATRLLSLNGDGWSGIFGSCNVSSEPIGRRFWLGNAYHQCAAIRTAAKLH